MSDEGTHDTIDALMAENRTFPPSEEFKHEALVTGTFLYDEAAEDDVGFWARQADELLHWETPWDTILDWQLPYAKWFEGGTLNVAYNCLDRHVEAGKGDKVAFHWEGEPGDTLTDDLRRPAHRGLASSPTSSRASGSRRGDRVNDLSCR